tara:strand:- start:1391 stop:1933 length:543 start_codon:yes stop_codon:yes gene_type:complete
MSAVLDFRDLRDKVLAGEMDDEEEPVETPLAMEAKQKGTLAAICISVASFAIYGYDRFANKDAPMFEGSLSTIVLAVGGFLPLGYALGGLNRGMTAQTEKERYERLLDESQTVIEEQQEEIESMEAEAEEEKEAEAQQESYHFDYLSAEDSAYHVPSIGSIPAFGQEGVLYRPKDTGMLW